MTSTDNISPFSIGTIPKSKSIAIKSTRKKSSTAKVIPQLTNLIDRIHINEGTLPNWYYICHHKAPNSDIHCSSMCYKIRQDKDNQHCCIHKKSEMLCMTCTRYQQHYCKGCDRCVPHCEKMNPSEKRLCCTCSDWTSLCQECVLDRKDSPILVAMIKKHNKIK